MTTRKSHGARAGLMPYARLPRAHHSLHVLTSTVDVFGAAHWLLGEHAPQPGGDVPPFDALVVSVHPGGSIELTELSAVRARRPHLDRLPDGGFRRRRASRPAIRGREPGPGLRRARPRDLVLLRR